MKGSFFTKFLALIIYGLFSIDITIENHSIFFSQINGNVTADAIDYFVTEEFGEGLYNSCKDVKFGTMNTRALEFIGAGARNYKGKLLC